MFQQIISEEKMKLENDEPFQCMCDRDHTAKKISIHPFK